MTGERTYEQGYEQGESSHAADWEFALGDLVPDDFDIGPTAVAKYIADLQAALRGVLDWDACLLQPAEAKERADAARRLLGDRD